MDPQAVINTIMKLFTRLPELITGPNGKLSHSKLIAIIVCLGATFYVVKSSVTGNLGSEIFGLYLMYGASQHNISKYIDTKAKKKLDEE
jgi:hypothetical protein